MHELIWVLLVFPLLILDRVSRTPEPRTLQRIARSFFSGFVLIDALAVGARGMSMFTSTHMAGVAIVAILQLLIAWALLEQSRFYQRKKKNGAQSGSND